MKALISRTGLIRITSIRIRLTSFPNSSTATRCNPHKHYNGHPDCTVPALVGRVSAVRNLQAFAEGGAFASVSIPDRGGDIGTVATVVLFILRPRHLIGEKRLFAAGGPRRQDKDDPAEQPGRSASPKPRWRGINFPDRPAIHHQHPPISSSRSFIRPVGEDASQLRLRKFITKLAEREQKLVGKSPYRSAFLTSSLPNSEGNGDRIEDESGERVSRRNLRRRAGRVRTRELGSYRASPQAPD